MAQLLASHPATIGKPYSPMQAPDLTDPVAIAEDLLERTGAAMMAGDFDQFAKYFHLPQQVETFETVSLLETEMDLRTVFDAVRTYYQMKGVTRMVRRCVSAAFNDAMTVASTHETRLLHGSQFVQKPFPAFSTIAFVNDGWKVTSCSYAIDDAPEHNRALSKLARV
jgi:hypothetical protein